MDKKQIAAREDFRQYLMVVMGLSEASARSYDAYVSGVENVWGAVVLLVLTILLLFIAILCSVIVNCPKSIWLR